jgi:hypothetical protein
LALLSANPLPHAVQAQSCYAGYANKRTARKKRNGEAEDVRVENMVARAGRHVAELVVT